MVYLVVTCDEIIEITKSTPTKSISIESITTKAITIKTVPIKTIKAKTIQNILAEKGNLQKKKM